VLARRSLLLAFSVALACDPDPAPPAQSVTAAIVGPVWAGCDDYVGVECVLIRGEKPSSIRAWVDVPPTVPIELVFDGVSETASAVPVDGGSLLRARIPSDARELVVRGNGVYGSLALDWHESHPAIAAVRKAMQSGALAEGCELLSHMPDDLTGRDRIDLLGYQSACIDPSDSRRLAQLFEEAAEIAAESGLRRSFVRAAHAAVHTHLERRADPSSARPWVLRMQERASGLPELEVLAHYCELLLLRREGSLSKALAAGTASVRWAERLGMNQDFMMGSEARATLLAELGRAEDSRELSRTLLDAAAGFANPCARARIIHNASWTQQLLADAGLDHDPPLDHMLDEAEIYESRACDNQYDRLIARINVATAALTEHDVTLASDWLELIEVEDRATASPELLAQIDYLELGIALESNRWDAVSLPLLTLAPAVGDARMRWRAAVREAQVLERFGVELAAVDAWRRAEALLDEDAAAVGVSDGRESFISGRSMSAVGLVEALLRQGDVEPALCRARIARGRALRRAVRDRGAAPDELAAFDEFLRVREELERDAGEDWAYVGDELEHRRARREERRQQAMSSVAAAFPNVAGPDTDCAALRPRAVDEVLLLLLPTRADTLVIAAGPSVALVEHMPSIPDDGAAVQAWSEAVLARVSPALDGASRVRVLPVGRAWSVAIHATIFDGAPLVERVAVAYGLDLPAGRTSAPNGTRVLIVADPTGDLPHAMTEGARVHELLLPHGGELELLTGPAALREDVLGRLGRADLFHYAGHGEHRGVDGWDDALLLSDRASIEAADVLALTHAPRTVVLAGCDTGAVNAGLFDGGMSLGRAFLLAGSDAVVVGDREVGDDVTQTFAEALYEGPQDRIFDAPELAVRDALRHTSASGFPVAAWSGFRLLVR
jgi:cellulose synthase operon protein C